MIGPLLRLCRPHYAVPMPLAYLLTLYYARAGRLAGEWAGAAVSTAALALVIAAAYVLNDVLDMEIDRTNAPGRPLPAGRVSRRAAAAWGILLLAAGLGLGLLTYAPGVNPGVQSAAAGCPADAHLAAQRPFAPALAAVAAGLMLYNVFSKRLGAAKPVLVAALMTSLYPLAFAQAGGAGGSRAPALAVFAAWMFLTAFGYEVLKDIRDIRGDRAAARRLTPLQRRPRVWRGIADAAILTAAGALALPLFLGCRWVYGAVAAAAGAAAVASVFFPVRRAISLVYAECFLVGVAAAADALIFGF